MKKSILPACLIAVSLTIGLGGCEKKSGDAVREGLRRCRKKGAL